MFPDFLSGTISFGISVFMPHFIYSGSRFNGSLISDCTAHSYKLKVPSENQSVFIVLNIEAKAEKGIATNCQRR